MAFQSRKNLLGAKQEQPKTVFTKLPDELLLYMLHQMDITEVLRLRETSRFFFNTCTEVMRDKLKVLYVHPSPRSIERAISICKQPDLSSKVEEICFVSKAPLWQDGRQTLLHGVHPRRWASHSPQDNADGPIGTFDQSYQQLLSSLAKLKCLQTVSFRESCDRAGFNVVSARRIANWQDTLTSLRGPENRLYATNSKPAPPMAFLFSDADALDAVLNSGISFTRSILPHELSGNPLSFRQSSFGERPLFFHPPPSILRPQILTHLDFTVAAYWKSCAWHAHCAELLRSAAASLVELRIGIRRSPRQDRDTVGSLRELLGDPEAHLDYIHLPRLRRLEFHCPPEWSLCTKQPVSVMKQSLDLDAFLEDHCKELRTLHLTDIDPTRLFPSLGNGHDRMKDIQLPDHVPARETKGLSENTRAWEILERDEGDDTPKFFSRWLRQQALLT